MSHNFDVNEMQVAFDRFCKQMSQFRAMRSDDQADWAPVVIRDALRLAAKLCGPKALRQAYGPIPSDATRAENLEAVSERLWALSHFFADVEDHRSGSAITEVAAEAFRVANGDVPILFAPLESRQGKRSNSFALAMSQLRGLEWEAYFKGMGLPPKKRRDLVTDAFGVTWDAMVKWRSRDLPKYLGSDVIRMKLATADREGSVDGWETTQGTDDRRLRQDGETYRSLLGFGS